MPADTPPPAPLPDLPSSLPHPQQQNEQQPPPNEQQQQNEQLQQQQQNEQQQQKEEEEEVAAVVAGAVAIEPDNNVANTHQSPPNNELQLHDHPHDAVISHNSDVSDSEDPPPEFVYVDLLAIRKEVQCPICLGIIKKTRTVMECLHRFCRECIDKSMRMGNNECPACRTHCASRRSLRDDPRYDELIASLYPDIKKFEEEELAFYEEDDSRNKQIQESISQVIMKQTEALGKKRVGSKETTGPSATRSQRNYQGTQSRRRRRQRRNSSTEYRDSDDNNDANESDKHLSPDEHHQEINLRKRKSRTSITPSHSPSTTNLSGGSPDNNLDSFKEEKGFSPGLTCSPDMLAWGKGGVRSNTRQNNVNGGTSAQRLRLTKLVDFFRNSDENNECMALEKPPESVNQEQDMQDPAGGCDHQSAVHPSPCCTDQPSVVAEPLPDKFHMLGSQEKLPGAVSNCISNGEQLLHNVGTVADV